MSVLCLVCFSFGNVIDIIVWEFLDIIGWRMFRLIGVWLCVLSIVLVVVSMFGVLFSSVLFRLNSIVCGNMFV